MTAPTLPPGARLELMEVEGFPALLRTGRWALAGIETALSVFLALWYPQRPTGAWIAMAILLLYNAGILTLLQRMPLKRFPVRVVLAMDLLLLANVSAWTGGIESPFLGQCYLIVFVAALFFDMWGGLLAGATAGLVALLLTFREPTRDNWEILRDTAPYFVIVGGFIGFLMRRAKAWLFMYRDGLAREQTRLQDEAGRRYEMELARSVQKSSLPMDAPKVDGVQIVLRAEPAREVGGDFHAFVVSPDQTRIGIALGDVSGKGIAAALVATSVGYLLPYLDPLRAPHAALQTLNADLLRRLPDSAFSTLIYAQIDLSAQTLTLYNAGHPPAILWRARTESIEETAVGEAPPLGLFDTWRAPGRQLTFEPGDLLVLLSDGLIEVRSEAVRSEKDGSATDAEQFGESRLRDLIQQHARHSAETVADALLEATRAWGPQADDLTIIVLQRPAVYPG